jgi:3-oxoacyl-[acyl-carrier protein] reductase
MKKLENKVALVTGSTRGIGLETAKLFAREGAKVVVSGRSEDAGRSAVEEIKAAGGEAFFRKTDIAKDSDLTALVQAAVAQYGRIDVLVNNAGVVSKFAQIEEISDEDWWDTLNIDVTAPFKLCRMIVPIMAKQGKGVIVNVSSVAALGPNRGPLSYSVAKAALSSLTRQLAFDCGKRGVRVNGVLPGSVTTDMLPAEIMNIPDHPATVGVKKGPAGRPGEAIETAQVILFLACDDSSYIYGQNIAVCGGTSL